jgi:hypothetical protein
VEEEEAKEKKLTQTLLQTVGKAEESESFFAYFTLSGSAAASLKQYNVRNIMRWNNNLISNRQFSQNCEIMQSRVVFAECRDPAPDTRPKSHRFGVAMSAMKAF